MLKHRLIFGSLMILGMLLVFILDSKLDQISIEGTWWQDLFAGRSYLPAGLPMLALFIVLIVFSVGELVTIFRANHLHVDRLTATFAGAVGCTLVYIIPHRMDSQTTLAVVVSMLTAMFMFALVKNVLKRETEGAVASAAAVMFTMVYAGLLPGFFLAIRRWHSPWIIVAIILITKSCDIGAYFTGRAIGRHKLIPWLSPGKTWEGLGGGVVLAAIVAMVLTDMGNTWGICGSFEPGRGFRAQHYPLWFAAVAGALFAVVGQMGDLTASLFKRDAGIKDSGHTVPGFGGVLDVVDSPILVAPVAFWMLAVARACFAV